METAVTSLLAGLADGDGKAACAQLTADARDQFKEAAHAASCEEAVKSASEEFVLEMRQALKSYSVTRAFTRGDSGKAEIDGDRTFGSPTGVGRVVLEKADGTWKINGFANTSGPENPVGACIADGLREWESEAVDRFWRREGRADFRDYLTQLCRRAEAEGDLRENGELVDQAAMERHAVPVLRRMIRRGQLDEPR